MVNISSLIVLHPAIQTPAEAADLLAMAPAAEFDTNIGVLETGLRESGVEKENAALRDFFELASLYFDYQAGGHRVQAFGPRQRLLHALRHMDPHPWQRARQTFSIPFSASLFAPQGKVRTQLLKMLGGGAPGIDWEERGLQRLEDGKHESAVAAFWQGAARAEQTGGEGEAAQLYLHAADTFYLDGKVVEAYLLNATAQWYAQVGQEAPVASRAARQMEENVISLRSEFFCLKPEEAKLLFAEWWEGFALALDNRFRPASAKLKKTADWLSKHHFHFAAGHVYKFLGDFQVRGGHFFPAMMAYAHAGLEMERAGFLPGSRLLKRRYAEAFALELGEVRSAEALLDRTVAIYQREIRRHRSLGEKELEAQALSNLLKNLLEEGRDQERHEETVAALRRAAQLYHQLGEPIQAADYFHRLGKWLWQSGSPLEEEILQAFDRAFELFNAGKQRKKAAEVLSDRAAYLKAKGNYRAAGLRYLELAEYYEIQGEAAYEPEMNALMDAVSAFKAGGAIERALLTLEKYRNKAHRHKDNDRVGTGWVLFGDILADNKQYSEALRAFYRAHQIFLESEGGQSMAVSCLVIMSYYLAREGEMDQSALAWQTAVHQAYHRVGEVGAPEGYGHLLLAEYLEGREEEAHAAAHYVHAVQYFQKNRDARSALALERLGKLQAQLGQWREAGRSLRRARRLYRFFVYDKGVERVEAALKELYGIN